jgi:hypothetical protein
LRLKQTKTTSCRQRRGGGRAQGRGSSCPTRHSQ